MSDDLGEPPRQVQQQEEVTAVGDDSSSRLQRHLNHLLFHAILQRPPNYPAAEQALCRGADVNAEFERESLYPVDVASVHNNEELMTFLISHGADINHSAFDGMAPLHRAVLFGAGNLGMVNLLLRSGKADPDLKTLLRQGQQEPLTPLQIVVAHGRSVAIAQSLVQHGADVHVRRGNGRTLLHMVDSVDMMEFLLGRGLDVQVTRDNGCTPLHDACFMGYLPVVKGLLTAGANPNHRSSLHSTPLHLAIVEGKLEVVKFMILQGDADPYLRGDHGAMALHTACLAKQKDVALWLIDEYNVRPSLGNYRGHDALHYACKYSADSKDPMELVRELLRRDSTLGWGTPTALHFAAEWHSDLCRMLVKDFGFSLMAESVLGSVPLCQATLMGSVETIHCLVDLMQERGHDLNVGDARGLTSLHEAVLGGSLEKVQALLQRGLDVNACSKCGETPLHAAGLASGGTRIVKKGERGEDDNATKQQTDILESLIDHGAYALHLDKDRMYPFCYSAKKGNVSKTFLLLRAAATQGFFGSTFVNVAAPKRSLEFEQEGDAKSRKRRRVERA